MNKNTNTKFKKGQIVKYAMKYAHGTVRGAGHITKLVPRNAIRGDARLTVVDAKTGVVRRPYPAQCKAA